MKLIIAEKPSVAAAYAAALGAKNKKDGYLEGNGCLVTWCIGHLVSLAEAGAYEERYKKWNYEDLPILPETFMEGIESMAKELIARYSHISEDKQKLFAPQKESVGVCPRCGQPVFEGKKNFYCGDRGCGFVLWKNDRFWTSRRKELTKKMAADLLSKGKTKVKGLYSEKKDTTYDAVIVMEDTGGKYINFKTEFTKGKGGR